MVEIVNTGSFMKVIFVDISTKDNFPNVCRNFVTNSIE